MRSKAMLAVLLAAVTGAVSLTGCGTVKNSTAIQIVCTNFPEYDWVRQIIAGHEDVFEVTYLLENGVDMHNYQPTAADIAKLSGCSLFIYNGGESEQWVKDALAEAINPELEVLCMMEEITPLAEETVEGMEKEEDEDEEGYDEHVWLSIDNAVSLCYDITEKICTLDPAHEGDYYANLQNYQEQLTALESDFLQDENGAASGLTLIVADRFPFRYFTDEFNYKYYAAFAGCSAETEASFETIAFLSQKVDELGIKTIFTMEGGNTAIAESVRDSTQQKNQQIRTLNSLQSVTAADIANGATYLSLMQENMTTLKEAAAAQ